mgnify:FL=1
MTFTLHPTLAADSTPVVSLELSDVRLMRDARYPWVLVIPRVANVKDAYQLDPVQQQTLTRESAQVSRALMALFAPFKLNVAVLGNVLPQLHLHHIARSPGDPAWPRPVWGVGEPVPYTDERLATRVQQLRNVLTVS